MAERFIRVLGLILTILLCGQFAYSQDVILECGSLELDRNIRSFRIPVNIANSVPIGGLALTITTDEVDSPYIFKPVGVDRSNGQIADWEYFNYTFVNDDSTRLRVTGIADFPGGDDTPPLPPGDGLLFDMLFEFGCDYSIDITVAAQVDSATFSDVTGYEIYDPEVHEGVVTICDDTALRGDANCDGLVIGSDITYLVSYLDYMVGCPCSLRAGDANADGEVNIADVVYLIRFFDGEGPPPGN